MGSSDTLDVPAREIVQVKLFELNSLACKCGVPIQVVLLSITNASEAIVSPYCSSCAANTVADLHREGFHSLRDDGESIYNANYIPEPT